MTSKEVRDILHHSGSTWWHVGLALSSLPSFTLSSKIITVFEYADSIVYEALGSS